LAQPAKGRASRQVYLSFGKSLDFLRKRFEWEIEAGLVTYLSFLVF
jgi:hypothetical protein